MKRPKGIILYEGPSMFDGKKIIVIANTFGNSNNNRKTGKMIQTWILRADIDPILAAKNGEDYSICGNCKHRDFNSCYVNKGFGPRNVYYAYLRGTYVPFTDDYIQYFKGYYIRIGSYGDPAAVPIEVWDNIYNITNGQTSYTHQWQLKKYQKFKKYCMTSVDTVAEYRQAIDLGWRTFRIRTSVNDTIFHTEFICPASNENNHKKTCITCGACCGGSNGITPCIIVHGGGVMGWKIRNFINGIKKIKNHKKWRKYLKIT